MAGYKSFYAFKLRGKGDTALPQGYEARMKQIQEIADTYEVRNIHNVDESGLFFRMALSRTYLAGTDKRTNARGTELQKHKTSISMVFCFNADGSHKLPMRYIGVSKKPVCFRDSRFSHCAQYYWSQANG